MYETAKMLVLSTGHLTEDTCNTWLHQAPFAVFEKGEWGWFVYVTEEYMDDWPVDLIAALNLAHTLRCNWIMFDRDGPLIEGLNYYEW